MQHIVQEVASVARRRLGAAAASAVALSALVVTIAAPATVSADPHGGFAEATAKCSLCHVVHVPNSVDASGTYHVAEGSVLLFPRGRTPKELCYMCHDGTGSAFDVQTEFGESGESKESSHPVAAGILACSDCHTPHVGPDEGNPRSLAVGPSRESTGIAVCGVCHGSDSSLPSGDILSAYAGTAHDASMPPPASGTQITCARCHVPHGSTNTSLIPTAVVGSSGVTRTVSVTATSGPRPLCEGCHDERSGDFGGPALYAVSKHGMVASSSLAATGYPGAGVPAGDCENCHQPHGVGQAHLLRAAVNGICFACHDASGVSYPASYSYRGSTVMSSTPHVSIEASASHDSTDTSGCPVCHEVHGGGERSWDDTTVPGSIRAYEGTLCTGGGPGGAGGCHALAANSASGVSILEKLTAGANASARHSVLASDQASAGGRIRCSDCHGVHADTAAAKYSDPDSIDATLAAGFSRFIDAYGRVFALIGAEHDGVAPVISNDAVDMSGGSAAPVFTWNTDESATTWVDWGITTSYEIGSVGTTLPLTVSHSVAPSGVDPTTEYHYRLRSADALGNERVTGDYRYKGDVTLSSYPTPTPVPDQYTGVNGTSVTLTWAPVTVSDGHTPQYYVEITNGTTTYSPDVWITGTSWTTPRLRFAMWTWRVRARDPIHLNAASPWMHDDFTVQYWEELPEGGAISPDTGAAPDALPSDPLARVDSIAADPLTIGPLTLLSGGDASLASLPLSEFGAACAPATARAARSAFGLAVLPAVAGVQVAVAEPAEDGVTFSLDTDYLALQARSRDRATVSYAPSAGWESEGLIGLPPTPLSPGTPVSGSVVASATNLDSAYWVTDLASADRHWSWQVASFDLGANAPQQISEIALSWTGHGEPTADYATRVWLWNRVAGAWEQIYTGSAVGADTQVAAGITTSVNDSFCLKCHDGALPSGVVMRASVATITPIWGTSTSPPSDLHGPRAGTAGPNMSSGGFWVGYGRGGQVACAVCHDPHGSAAPFGLARVINGVDTTGTAGGNLVSAACHACHTGATTDWHVGCISCHNSYDDPDEPDHSNPRVDFSDTANCLDCHNHGSRTKWGTVGIVGAPGCGRASHSRSCHTWATTF